MEHRIDQLLHSHTRGRTLTDADRRFVTLLLTELEQFQHQAPKDRALMFHPLGSYERYLIHKATEIFSMLTSFSIGGDTRRRVIVCFKSRRKEQQQQFGQALTEKLPPSSRGSAREPRGTPPRGDPKSRTLGNPRGRSSDRLSRNKMGKYETWNGEAVRKRERGLNMEGPVVNGERDFPKSDVEAARREPRDYHDLKKHPRHRARRSRSQPHLNERSRHRRHQDSFEESSDHQFSDVENFGRRTQRPVSENNTPEKRRNKPYRNESVPMERIKVEALRSDVEYVYSSSGSDIIVSDRPHDNSDTGIDNDEIPSSYEKIPDRKSKAKRNLRRIRRSNSTTSCPPMNREKRDYSNRETLLKENNRESSHQDSPVITRKEKSDVKNSYSDARPRSDVETRKGSSKRKSRKDRKPSREYVNVSNEEILRPNSYDSLPFESSPQDVPDGVANGFTESVATVENAKAGPPYVDSLSNHFNEAKKPAGFSSELQPVVAEVLFKPTKENSDKECQTDLHGMVIDAMMTTYNAQLDAFSRLAPPNLSASQPGSTIPPSSLRTSGTSTPSLSSPASAYEKMGEYMYKAMLNFQNMLLGGMPQSANGPSTFPTTTPMYAPIAASAQPLYVPWMTQYYPDPNTSRPSFLSPPRSGGDACCHLHHHSHKTSSPLDKMQVHSQSNLKDLHGDVHRLIPSRDDIHYWHGNPVHHYHGNKDIAPSSVGRSVSAHPSRSSKAPDGFESDVSSEITNPEVTIAPGGDGVMVYVRNSSNRSTSSTGCTSVAGSANSLHGPAGDNVARESPLGHVGDNVFKKASNLSVSRQLSKPAHSKEKTGASKGSPKKNGKSHRKNKSKDRPIPTEGMDFVNGPGTANEAVLPLGSAPLATMEDEIEHFTSVPFTLSHSSHHDNKPFADSAKSLVGEDLSPLVCFDDNLEIACEDGSAED